MLHSAHTGTENSHTVGTDMYTIHFHAHRDTCTHTQQTPPYTPVHAKPTAACYTQFCCLVFPFLSLLAHLPPLPLLFPLAILALWPFRGQSRTSPD